MFDGINITEAAPTQGVLIHWEHTCLVGLHKSQKDSLDLVVRSMHMTPRTNGYVPTQDTCSEAGYPRLQVADVLNRSPPVIHLIGPMPSGHEIPPKDLQPKSCSLMSKEPGSAEEQT